MTKQTIEHKLHTDAGLHIYVDYGDGIEGKRILFQFEHAFFKCDSGNASEMITGKISVADLHELRCFFESIVDYHN